MFIIEDWGYQPEKDRWFSKSSRLLIENGELILMAENDDYADCVIAKHKDADYLIVMAQKYCFMLGILGQLGYKEADVVCFPLRDEVLVLDKGLKYRFEVLWAKADRVEQIKNMIQVLSEDGEMTLATELSFILRNKLEFKLEMLSYPEVFKKYGWEI